MSQDLNSTFVLRFSTLLFVTALIQKRPPPTQSKRTGCNVRCKEGVRKKATAQRAFPCKSPIELQPDEHDNAHEQAQGLGRNTAQACKLRINDL